MKIPSLCDIDVFCFVCGHNIGKFVVIEHDVDCCIGTKV